MINKLLDNCFLTELNSEVIDVKEENEYYWHAFKETIFYPEGGGMADDIGVIDNHKVLKLKEEEGRLYHLLDVRLEGSVFMSVNLHERFRKCQIHTSQHLISALLGNVYKVKTLSHHVSDEENDIEFDFDHFTDKMAFELQVLCNGLIRDDLEISIIYPTRASAQRFVSADKLTHEELRVVRIGNLDYNLCGCMHVPSLRYLQMIYISGYEKTKHGYKVKYICGDQLLDSVGKRYQVLDEASRTLALSHLYLNTGIHKLLNEQKALEHDVAVWKQKYLVLESERLLQKEEDVLHEFVDDMDIKSVVMLAQMIAEKKRAAVILAKIYDNCHVVIAVSKTSGLNAKELFQRLSQTIHIRGGGTELLAQGGGIYQESWKETILSFPITE